MSTYTISVSTSHQSPALRATYSTRDSAVGALATVLGWTCGAVLSDDYAVTLPEGEDGRQRHGRAWSCYPSQEACDADRDGAHAPRIVETT